MGKARGVLTLAEAAEEAGLSRDRLLDWIKRGKLKAWRVGERGNWFVYRRDLETFRRWWLSNRYAQRGKQRRKRTG